MIKQKFGNRMAVAVIDEDSAKKELCYGCICYMSDDSAVQCPPCPKHAPYYLKNMVWHWAGLSEKVLKHFEK